MKSVRLFAIFQCLENPLVRSALSVLRLGKREKKGNWKCTQYSHYYIVVVLLHAIYHQWWWKKSRTFDHRKLPSSARSFLMEKNEVGRGGKKYGITFLPASVLAHINHLLSILYLNDDGYYILEDCFLYCENMYQFFRSFILLKLIENCSK